MILGILLYHQCAWRKRCGTLHVETGVKNESTTSAPWVLGGMEDSLLANSPKLTAAEPQTSCARHANIDKREKATEPLLHPSATSGMQPRSRSANGLIPPNSGSILYQIGGNGVFTASTGRGVIGALIETAPITSPKSAQMPLCGYRGAVASSAITRPHCASARGLKQRLVR